MFAIHDFVRNPANGDTLQVLEVFPDAIKARGARIGSHFDTVLLPPSIFEPASIEGRIRFLLEDAGAPVRLVNGHGSALDEFDVHFGFPVSNPVCSKLVALGLEIIEQGERSVHVRAPADWLISSPSELGTRDSELTATAAEIKRLQQQIADLRAERDALLMDRRPASRAEVAIVRDITPALMETHLVEGWEVVHMQFVTDALHVVFTRPAKPAPLTGDHVAAARPSITITPAAPPARIHNGLPLAKALQTSGLAAVEAALNADLFTAGSAAYEARIASHPVVTSRPAFLSSGVNQ